MTPLCLRGLSALFEGANESDPYGARALGVGKVHHRREAHGGGRKAGIDRIVLGRQRLRQDALQIQRNRALFPGKPDHHQADAVLSLSEGINL